MRVPTGFTKAVDGLFYPLLFLALMVLMIGTHQFVNQPESIASIQVSSTSSNTWQLFADDEYQKVISPQPTRNRGPSRKPINARLKGVLGANTTGIALISVQNAQEKPFKVGDPIGSGWYLSELGVNQVTITDTVSTRILSLAEEVKGARRPQGRRTVTSVNTYDGFLKKFSSVRSARYGPGVGLTDIDDAILKSLQLDKRDVILEINGVSSQAVLDKPQNYAQFLNENDITLSIERNAQKIDLTVSRFLILGLASKIQANK